MKILQAMVAACVAMAALHSAGYAAQGYPDRPIRLVVPYPPGGAADIIGRTLGGKLAEELGQQVIVDNRAGGGQIIGTEVVARAPADGYTILQCSITQAINPSLRRHLPYDTVKAFAPISFIASSPLVLVVHPSLPVHTVKQLIALAKARPGELNYASSGIGSGGHLAMALFVDMTHTNIAHVPYKGAGPAMVDLIAGQTQMLLTSPIAAVPHVKAGQLRLIAVTSAHRSAAMPNVPTIGETVPGYEASLWYGFLAPAGTPHAIVMKLNAAVRKALAMQDVRTLFAKYGADVSPGSPEQFQKYIVQEIAKWRTVIRNAGIKPE